MEGEENTNKADNCISAVYKRRGDQTEASRGWLTNPRQHVWISRCYDIVQAQGVF